MEPLSNLPRNAIDGFLRPDANEYLVLIASIRMPALDSVRPGSGVGEQEAFVASHGAASLIGFRVAGPRSVIGHGFDRGQHRSN